MGYSTILLDADGTLLDFAAAQRSAFFTAMHQLGIAAEEGLLDRYDRINHAQWKRLERGEVTRTQILVERFEKLAEECGFCYDPAEANRLYGEALSESAQLIDGAILLLETLRPVASLAIITNGVPKSQHRRFALSGIDRYVDHVIVSGEVGWEKPSPHFFSIALARCGVKDPREVLVVGDSLTADIAGAVLSGLDCCWYNPDRLSVLEAPYPTYTAQSLEEVAGIVLQSQRNSYFEQQVRNPS